MDARDRVLDELYDSISEEFVRLYRKLHADENSFEARLLPQNAGLNLLVEFYGRGTHPPNALHSEGHQDSMGLCLFLVLSRKLSGVGLEIMLLDDVVMSVDVGHRKALAELLKDEFDDRQIIVATHDRIWLEQLRKEQFATKANIVELLRWDIEGGPATMHSQDVWDRIDRDLEENDVNAASARLRRWAESFFRHVCDSFRIPVRYRIDQLWTLSDFLDPACGQIKSVIKKAKSSAQEDKDTDLIATIQALDDRRGEIYRIISREKWMVNTTVHFNPVENISVDEFMDVVNAFREFYDLLHSCRHCSRLLRVTETGDGNFIMCGCGKICWKL